MLKKSLIILTSALFFFSSSICLAVENNETTNYLEAVINVDTAVKVGKSTIFDASQSFIPEDSTEVSYKWSFGDGNSNEGEEVLHSYKEPGFKTVKLTLHSGTKTTEKELNIFAYNKMILLITDQTEDKERIQIFQNIAEKEGIYLKVIESFGSSTEFISEEILTKKLTEEATNIQKAQEIIIWAKENAGLNAISRFLLNNKNSDITLSQKSILVINNELESNLNGLQRQFEVIKPRNIIISREAAIDDLIESKTPEEFTKILEERGTSYQIINAQSGKVRPWNFMGYLVNILINNGIPDNTIALLLLLPVIATVVAFMRQVVGITTFGIYTPSIITLSFLIIGMHAGLLTLLIAIIVGSIARYMLRHVRMLFIPKMALVITLVSLSLLFISFASIELGFFDAQFLSLAIFPMLILSTLVEKFVSAKTGKSYSSAIVLMAETLVVAIIAYFIAGGEIDLGFLTLKFEFIKRIMLSYPELVLVFLIINILIGKWTGLRVSERFRFKEVLSHIEE